MCVCEDVHERVSVCACVRMCVCVCVSVKMCMCEDVHEGVCLAHQCSPHLFTREQFIDIINGIEVSLIQRVVAREHL